MKALLLVFFFSTFFYSYSQHDMVEDNANEFVCLVLNNSCLELLNTAMSSLQSVGCFNKNSSSFPLNEGVIVRNVLVTLTAGNYSNSNLSAQLNINTDSFLQNFSYSTSLLYTPIKDVAFLDFDFIPAFNSYNFDFLFFFNEYGKFQYFSNDVFAFVLTNLNIGKSTNLAVLSGSSIPVKNIRNADFNSNFTSSNSGYIGENNFDNPSASFIIYQLDNGEFQSCHEFNNLSTGIHPITVRDTLGGCGNIKIQYVAIKQPKLFTPNIEGYHDTWNIWDFRNAQYSATISILDRYGKKITQITPASYG